MDPTTYLAFTGNNCFIGRKKKKKSTSFTMDTMKSKESQRKKKIVQKGYIYEFHN